MSSTGNVFPGTGANDASIGATAWTNPGNITATDASDATCNAGASSQYLVAKNFGFAVPSGSAIVGITVRVNASETSAGSETLNARLQDAAGALFGTGKTASINGTTKIVYTYGSTSDVWGATLNDTIVNDADFGVRLWYTTAHNVAIDYVTLAVEYTSGTTALTTQLVTSSSGLVGAGPSQAPVGQAVTTAQQAIPSLGTTSSAVLGAAATFSTGLVSPSGGRQIQSAQGLLSPTTPLLGRAITSGRGDVTADAGPPVGEVIDGIQVASGRTDPPAAMFVKLQSKKIVQGGSSASRPLVGSTLMTSAAGLFTPVPMKTPAGQLATLLGGTIPTRGVARLLGGIGASASPGLVGAPSSGSDNWATRAAGATVANRLELQATRDAWVLVDGTQGLVTIDNVTKAPGALGSFKFSVLNTTSTNDGSVGVPLGRTFSPGDTVWFSFRVVAPAGWTYQPWTTVKQGAKLAILSHSSGSNQVNEVVSTLQYNLNEFQGYNQNGTDSPSVDVPLGGSDFRLQGSIDNGANTLSGTNPDTGSAWSSAEQDRRRYSSLYSARNTAPVRPGLGDPLSGGVKMRPGVFYTITGRLVIGTAGTPTSRWTQWVAADLQPYIKLWDISTIQLGNGPAYNTFWLLPYVTGRSPGGRKVSSTSGTIGGVSVLSCGMGTELGSATLEYTASNGRFRFRTTNDNYGPSRGFSATNALTHISVESLSDRFSTFLNGSVALPQNSINVIDASGLPTAGTVVIGEPDTSIGGVGEERVQYTGKSGNALTGCTGGTGAHASGQSVHFANYVVLRLDNAASLPSSGVTTMAVTIADGRPDTQINYNDVIISTSAILSPGGTLPEGSALSSLAASMSAGTWAELTTTSIVTAPVSSTSGMWLMATGSGLGGIGADSNNMAWDPVHKRMHFVGQYHGNVGTGMRHVQYDAASNTWSTVTHFGPLGDDTGHGLSAICCNTFTGDVYFKRYGPSAPLAKFTYSTQTWDLNAYTAPDITNISTGTVFWSGALTGVTGGAGAVVLHDADFGHLMVLDVGTGTWVNTTSFPDQSPGYDNVAAYNAVSNSGMFGGGENPSQIPMKMTSSKVVTSLASIAPNALSIRSGTLCEHPTQGGAYLSIARDGHLWKFLDNGISIDLGALPSGVNRAPDGTNGDAFVTVCAIPEYGVMMSISTTSSTARCHLYKASTGTYSTTFPLTENPINESGVWINGGPTASGGVGGNWQNARTNGTSAFGVAVSAGYDDCIAVLNSGVGISSTSHYAQGTVKKVAGYSPGTSHEIEILTGFTITSGVARGYEVTWDVSSSSPQIVRWNGAISDFTVNGSSNDNVGGGKGWTNATSGPGGGGALTTGDVVKVTYAVSGGNVTLTIFKNGVMAFTVQDTSAFKITSGQPGMGFFGRAGATMSSYCWSSFSAG